MYQWLFIDYAPKKPYSLFLFERLIYVVIVFVTLVLRNMLIVLKARNGNALFAKRSRSRNHAICQGISRLNQTSRNIMLRKHIINVCNTRGNGPFVSYNYFIEMVNFKWIWYWIYFQGCLAHQIPQCLKCNFDKTCDGANYIDNCDIMEINQYNKLISKIDRYLVASFNAATVCVE